MANVNPYGALTKEVNVALDELVNDESHYVPQRPAEELFRIDNVQIFFISAEGKVSTFSEPSKLRIFQFKEAEEPESWNPVFIQVNGWTHPLIEGASPVLEAANGAFMFPDVYADSPGASIGIVLSDEIDVSVRDELRKVLEQHTALKSQALDDVQLGSIGKTIVKGAEYVNKGLDYGAQKACNLIEYVTEQQKAKMPQAESDAKVSSALRYSVTGAKYATHASVKVSGFVAKRVGKRSKKLADHLATKVAKSVTGPEGSNGSMKQSSSMRSIIDAARGGLIAYGTVYAGLEDSAKVLGGCVKEKTVDVVQHKYGDEAGDVYGNAMTAAGNAAMTYLNVQSLGAKGLVKRTAKDTAKGVGKKIVGVDEKKPKLDETS